MSRKLFGALIMLVFVSVLTAAPSPVSAQEDKSPIQLALFTPVQIFPENYTISGVRLNLLYGRNVSVTGLDFGFFVNHTTGGVSKGVQIGLVGLNEADFVGFQNNFVNIVRGDFEGFQWGFVNHAHYANGFQLGVVNYAESMKGIQIGLVNIIKQGGQFPVFPFFNWSF